MRILHVSHAMPPDGVTGVENYTATLSRLQADAGHEVLVFTRGKRVDVPCGVTEESEADGYRIVRDHLGPGHHRPHHPHRPDVAARFAALLASFRPDIVSIQHLVYHCLSYPALARAAGARVVLTLHDLWPGCPTLQRLDFEGVVCARPPGVGCVACVWGGRKARYLPPRALRRLADLPVLSRLVAVHPEAAALADWASAMCAALAPVDRTLAPSDFVAQDLATHGIALPGLTRVTLGPLRPGPHALARVDGPLRLGLVGSHASKGVGVAYEAMRRLAGRGVVTLVHYGEALGEPPPGVTVRGRYPLDALDRVFSDFDVLLAPSVWYENAPMVVREAFARGRAVVASEIGGLTEMVRDGVDGLLFPAGDAAALAERIARLIDEPGLRERLRDGIRAQVFAHEHAATVEALYAGLV